MSSNAYSCEIKRLKRLPAERSPSDEGMTNEPSIFAYLIFGLGRVVIVGKTRPTKDNSLARPRSKTYRARRIFKGRSLVGLGLD
jgi:hypothetical protein